MTRELFVAEPRKTYNKLPPIVVDCSLLAAILFNEPSRDEALEALSGKSLHVPYLIDHEIISVAVKKTEANDGDTAGRGLNSFRKLRLDRRKRSVLRGWRVVGWRFSPFRRVHGKGCVWAADLVVGVSG